MACVRGGLAHSGRGGADVGVRLWLSAWPAAARRCCSMATSSVLVLSSEASDCKVSWRRRRVDVDCDCEGGSTRVELLGSSCLSSLLPLCAAARQRQRSSSSRSSSGSRRGCAPRLTLISSHALSPVDVATRQQQQPSEHRQSRPSARLAEHLAASALRLTAEEDSSEVVPVCSLVRLPSTSNECQYSTRWSSSTPPPRPCLF